MCFRALFDRETPLTIQIIHLPEEAKIWSTASHYHSELTKVSHLNCVNCLWEGSKDKCIKNCIDAEGRGLAPDLKKLDNVWTRS